MNDKKTWQSTDDAKWEKIDVWTHRMPVPGGWLVRVVRSSTLAVVFVADPPKE